jgi:hypothetical protein
MTERRESTHHSPLTVLAAIVALCLAVSATAAEFTFAAFGDTPYSREEEERFPDLIAEMNREPLEFVAHVGDFKIADARCDDALFLQRREWFDYSRHPFVFVPGDNEWSDCGRWTAGRYDPLERLGKLREIFHRGDESLGQRRIRLERQSAQYPEHARWRHGGLLFVALNVPGGANNARQMPEEFRARNAAGIQWLGEAFRIARADGSGAVVVFMQANPWASPSSRYFGYRELLSALARETRDFRGEVLLVHGDTHRHRVDRPLRDPGGGAPLPNFTRVEVFGYPTMNWVRIRVSEERGRVRFEVTPGS